jgi:hypothetical protein
MIVTDGKEICQRCRRKPSVVLCDGCSIPLCVDCRKFDMWGYGCGHVDTKAFCLPCADDEKINPYGGKMD